MDTLKAAIEQITNTPVESGEARPAAQMDQVGAAGAIRRPEPGNRTASPFQA